MENSDSGTHGHRPELSCPQAVKEEHEQEWISTVELALSPPEMIQDHLPYL